MNMIATKLQVTYLKEGAHFLAYCSALDLSTSGDTFEETKKNFDEMLGIFIEETLKMGTLENVLLDCGWRKIRKPKPHWQPPVRHFIKEVLEEIKLPCPT